MDEPGLGDHFDWLVESRSRNQKSALALHKLIERSEPLLSRDILRQLLAQDLVAIVFSLWRAVFLSDLKGEPSDQLSDVRRFLQSLIAHNAILYQTDFSTREWTFRYYLDNAVFRLQRLVQRAEFGALIGFDFTPTYAKDDWSIAQDALDLGLKSFEAALLAADADDYDPGAVQ